MHCNYKNLLQKFCLHTVFTSFIFTLHDFCLDNGVLLASKSSDFEAFILSVVSYRPGGHSHKVRIGVCREGS